MRRIKRGIIHCTATKPQWMEGQPVEAKVAEIDRWHRGNGWRGIGYHYVIDRDGTIGSGRDVSEKGAHVKGHNADSIGIALAGGHGGAETDAFGEHFTPQQDRALRRMMDDLGRKFPGITWSGHNQYAAKACPCFRVPAWINNRPAQPNPFTALIEAILRIFRSFGGKK